MKDGLQGISQDRLLIRIVNYMQIIGGIFGAIGVMATLFWSTHKMLEKIDTLIVTVHQHTRDIKKISDGQKEMEEKFANFQKMFRGRRPGGWIYQDGDWKWSENSKR